MKKIKVLIVSTSGFSKKEGISTIIYDYFSRFDKNQFEIQIAVQGSYSSVIIEKFKTAGIDIRFLPSRKKNVLRYFIEFIKLFKKEKFDILYVHGSSSIMSLELFGAFISGCKVRIVHSHNTTCKHKLLDKILRPFFNKLYTDAFACGEAAGKWLYGNKKFIVIKNGRDINEFAFDPEKRIIMRERLKLNDKCLAVGHVGSFVEQKNHQFILKTFYELKKLYSNSKLFLIGSGPEVEKNMNLANELGISNDVIFTGSIDNVNEMLQALDVMALPSLHEGLPLVVVEWQMAALPCVLSSNVTKEVSFCDLVHYMPIDSNYSSWAKKLINVSKEDRKSRSIDVIRLASDNQFDINGNVHVLETFFLKRYEGKNI